MIAQIVFWLAGGLILYAYAGFPLLLLVRARARGPRPELSPGLPPSPSSPPRVSMVIVAHNEAETIGAKIENIDALDYPIDRMEVILASDGSDDGTAEIVARHPRRHLRFLALPRTGKIPALNAAVAHARGEILVFSDANSMFAPDALRALVAPFSDPAVGAVGGNQCYLPDGGGHMASSSERLYWGYDRALKSMQSRAGHMTAATGAIHAVRRELFRPVPLGVSDDFMTSTQAIAEGYRLVFEPKAIAYEALSPSEAAELSRKLRIIVRGLRGLWVMRGLFNPLRHRFYSLQLFSHKLLRWSVCWLLLALLGASLRLYGETWLYTWAARVQIGLYACAMAGLALRSTRIAQYRLFKLFGPPFYFCMANYAALRAWLHVVGGARVDLWESERSAGGPPARRADRTASGDRALQPGEERHAEPVPARK
jgi:cellulose synthase/poly-beta-1,6-N-acetylglucosamine synthase-like glycosyltransferase